MRYHCLIYNNRGEGNIRLVVPQQLFHHNIVPTNNRSHKTGQPTLDIK